MTSSYEKDYAGIYDLFYTDKDYDGEARFVTELIKGNAGNSLQPKVLDLACGTGRHLEIMQRLGCDMAGVDISEGMLSQAKSRLQASGMDAALYCQDMRGFSIPGGRFDAVVSFFDSIGYALTNEGVRQTLRRVREHLREGGLFVFEFWHAAAMLRHHDPCRVREVVSGDTGILRISRTDIDYRDQTATVKYTFVEKSPEGQRMWNETHRNRCFSIPEMELFLETEGFTGCRFFPGYGDAAQGFDDCVWHIVGSAALKS